MASFLDHQPVVAEVVRNGLVESVHHGIVVGLDAADQVALRVGDPTGVIFPRSASKPIQAVAMLRSGVDLDGELLALAAASHSGEEFHVEGARRILGSVGLDDGALLCPPALPMDLEDLSRWVRAGGEPAPIFMNCSGKHAAMLATCVVNDWPTETYTDPEHPLQVVIRATLQEFTGDRVDQVGVDGCGAPVFGYTLLGLARAFRAVGLAAEGTAERRVADAFRHHPEWTSGTRRDETRLMRAVPGLVNKAGADGVDAISLSDGRTVAVKIADGNPRARMPVVVAALRRLGVDAPGLDALASTPVLGGINQVGEIRAVI